MSFSLVDLWYPGESNRAVELEKRNRELNQRKLEKGQVNEDWVRQQEGRFNADGPDTYNSQIANAAGEGAMEGLATMPGKVRSALTSGAGWTLAFVPWWAWLIGAGVAFGYLGGWSSMRGVLNRK